MAELLGLAGVEVEVEVDWATSSRPAPAFNWYTAVFEVCGIGWVGLSARGAFVRVGERGLVRVRRRSGSHCRSEVAAALTRFFDYCGTVGDAGGRLWWAVKLRRFEPGELDGFDPTTVRRLDPDAPIPALERPHPPT